VFSFFFVSLFFLSISLHCILCFLSSFLVSFEPSVFVSLYLVSAQTFICFLQCSIVLLPIISFFFYCCTVHFDNIKITFTNECTLY
jgi:hypothetical protein